MTPPPPFRDAVSIVIPAYEAAATLAETLASVRAQTHPDWEAIVVDDGSTDATAAIGDAWAARDPRIRCLRRPRGGVSRARNAGVARASHDWLLFLDADDLLRPTLLERLLGLLRDDPTLDVATCAAARLSGAVTWDRIAVVPPEVDLFPEFATGCAIHTCAMLFRRDVIEDAGGFVPDMRNCQDWDLWQRVARAGARFGGTPEILALYRVRPGSATFNYEGDLTNGIRVLETGHREDPRVLHARPEHLHGLRTDDLPAVRAAQVCWVAGQLLGRGDDARPLLASIGRERAPRLDARSVAHQLFTASLLPGVRTPAHAWELWPAITGVLRPFLTALEALTGEPTFARRVERRFEQLALEAARVPAARVVGATYVVPIAVETPLADVRLPPGASRLRGVVTLAGAHLGNVEVPAGAPLVPRAVVADAVAYECYWPILGRWLAPTAYRELELRREAGGTSVWRGTTRLVTTLPRWKVEPLDVLHHQVGWTVFLQELWGRPGFPEHAFYDPAVAEPASVRRAVPVDGRLDVEVGDELPDVEAEAPFDVVVTVGGVTLGTVPFVPAGTRTPAQALRATVTRAAGIELARAAVAAALVGCDPARADPLRARLATAARAARAATPPVALPAGGTADTIVIPRRDRGHPIGSPAARPVALPAAIVPDLLACAERAREPVLYRDVPRAAPGPTLSYAPEILWVDRSARAEPLGPYGPAEGDARGFLEERWARTLAGLDGVRAEPPVARDALLARLPAGPIGKALLLGSADGALVAALASRVERLVACHASRLVLAAVTSVAPAATHVSARRIDEVEDPLPGRHDVVMRLDGTGRALDRASARTVAAKLRDATRNGGLLILAGSDGASLAEEVHALTDMAPEDAPRDDPASPRCFRRRVPVERARAVRAVTPPTEGPGPAVRRPPARPVAARADPPEVGLLPILRFPTVAPGPADGVLAPARFEEHLCALERAGGYSVGLATWADARREHRPLPGRPLLLTMDGNARAFAEHAWPLLRRHGFRAMLFVATAELRAPDDWDALRRLRDDGVEVGSRGVTARHLTMLTAAEVAEEAARSRAELERRLDAPVRAIAYPHGDVDAIVQRIVAACGYWFGLGAEPPSREPAAHALALPRIAVAPDRHYRAVLARLDGGA